MFNLERIAVVGVGLIGGSTALALKRAGVVGEVIGVGRNAASLEEAKRLNVIDRACDLAEAAAIADCILIATPVRQMPAIFATVAPHLRANALVMDAGSTKQDVIAAARIGLGHKIAQFVPAHPIAGRETSGVATADATLYKGKKVVLTPVVENPPEAIAKAEAIWRACGATVQSMSAEAHDAIFAAVSHLPHMLAFALVDEFAGRPNAKTLFAFAASGFRDFTRIAGSHPEMWRDIALNNRDALLTEIDLYIKKIAQLREWVAQSDAAQIEAVMQRSHDAKANWLAGDLEYFRDESV